MIYWVCGKYKAKTDLGVVWDFQGIYESEELAIKNCRNATYFIAPIEMNKPLPDDTEVWPGCYYPIRVKV